MDYYAKRHKLLDNDFTIKLVDLRRYLYQLFCYFDEKGFFERAFGTGSGVFPSMSPSPEIYFMQHLNSTKVFPISEYYERYSESQIFTIIEMLYEHVGEYDLLGEFINDTAKSEFCKHTNNVLVRYGAGYYLNETNGFIMELPNEALRNLIETELPESIDEGIQGQLKTAAKMFYKFDSNEEEKKKAINILADVLEPIRNELKDILNDEYSVNKNEHDKLIFGIVNGFNIRHNDDKQLKKYSKSVWYEWMMHYYFSVIITFYRLKMRSDE